MASTRGLEGNISNPSIPASDTPYASSDVPENVSPQQQTFGPRTSSLPSARARAQSNPSTSPVKRKPLPATASPIATRFSSSEYLVNKPDARFMGPPSVESPTLSSQADGFPVPNIPEEFLAGPRNLTDVREHPALDVATIGVPPHRTEAEPISTSPVQYNSVGSDSSSTATSHKHARVPSESAVNAESNPKGRWFEDFTPSGLSRSATMSLFSAKPKPPQITLPPNDPVRIIFNEASNLNKQLPRSPGASKLGTFFGWGGHNSASSSITSISEREADSPAPSPMSPERHVLANDSHLTDSSTSEVSEAKVGQESYFEDKHHYKSLPHMPPNEPVDNMKSELKMITSELAISIRREMELEDLVERLQAEAANHSGPGRRTSDYFSDSGTSSVKYAGDPDTSRTEEWERLQRIAEREKAQIKLDLTARVQEERSRREELEMHVRDLEGKALSASRDASHSSANDGRLRDLEASCEDLRRRLTEERQVKENFEDLLKAIKNELQVSHNERDNLRDEVVPQLRARVEGLEAQAAEHEKVAYENTRKQQEMRSLKIENVTPTDSENSISRSSSGAQSSALRLNRPESSNLSRSSSSKWRETHEALADRVADIEGQRDALHRALKSLLERQEHQNREHQKRIRQVEMERDRALTSPPKKPGYNQEVANLRDEINSLRRRADEAIEQKWEREKGLSGLKMDLEQAEQEIGSLRGLLRDNRISIPANGTTRATSPTYDSLERAYIELKKAHVSSLDRIKELEKKGANDQETEKAMAQLQQSLSSALQERDFARRESETHRASVDSFQSTEKQHVESENALADGLRSSAKRVEELATQVRQQLASNANIRQRLAETIERGEKEQQANTARIGFMQGKLNSLEEALTAAQEASEKKVAEHEEEIRMLNESHNSQLVRVKDGMLTPRMFSPKMPMSPTFASGARSPGLGNPLSANPAWSSPESQTELLKSRVVELEKALEEADKEMEEVVNRMNLAQIEVMELQNEREEAVRQTKRLQAQIEADQLTDFQGRFATLTS